MAQTSTQQAQALPSLAVRRGLNICSDALLAALSPLRQILPLAIAAFCIWFLVQHVQAVDSARLSTAISQMTPRQWGLGLLATAISFWAVGRYDAVIHRHLRTGISTRQAQGAGASAIALGQTLGFGLIVGAAARWHALERLSLPKAAAISALVTGSFFAAWAVVTALACLLLSNPLSIEWPFAAVLIALPLALAFAFLVPDISLRGRRIRLPSLPAMGQIFMLTLLDTLGACAALYVFFPAADFGQFAMLFPVFLLALGAALASGTPGGVGAFELTLLALLPAESAPDLLAAIICFRVVYYVLPAALAFVSLCARPRQDPPRWPAFPSTARIEETLLQNSARAEHGLARQAEACLLRTPRSALLVVRTGQTCTALFDPLHGTASDAQAKLVRHARSENRVACVYKCGAQTAVGLRRKGWRVLKVAQEALIDPARFTLDRPCARQLRRKLRQSNKAGLRLSYYSANTPSLPLGSMGELDRAWSQANGRARGFSMGLFCPNYLRSQEIVLAWQHNKLVGFATFHASSQQHCLDLMRLSPEAPHGTMHALVHHAIEQAKAQGVREISLAALPARWLPFGLGRDGARQFKACFVPRFAPLYIAAPSRRALVLAGLDIARAVHRPRAPAP